MLIDYVDGYEWICKPLRYFLPFFQANVLLRQGSSPQLSETYIELHKLLDQKDARVCL